MKKTLTYMIVTGLGLGSMLTHAAVEPELATQLGTTLTPWGAEILGNADGSIPPYTKPAGAPENYNPESPGVRPDPFAQERPLFSIDAHNVQQYADKLSEGTHAMLSKYAGYRLDIYPTHRNVDYPDYVQQNTVRNAVNCTTIGQQLQLENCYGGLPFPIPQTGVQVMWNHLVRYQAYAWQGLYRNYFVHGSGLKVLQSEIKTSFLSPFYRPLRTGPVAPNERYYMVRTDYTGPPRRAGEKMVLHNSIDMLKGGQSVWQYLPGMRRVKLSPNLMYDTPNPHTGGSSAMDESQLFHGPLDYYDFNLLGKREVFIPYNNFRINDSSLCPVDKKLQRHYLHPDCVRWELHRVWVIQGTLKPGKRHMAPKRMFYFDEDAPGAGVADSYDYSGQIARAAISLSFPMYEAKGIASDSYTVYDFLTGSYALLGDSADTGGAYTSPPKPLRFYSPEAMAADSVR